MIKFPEKISRRNFLSGLGLASIGFTGGLAGSKLIPEHSAAGRRPNVVVIIADDMRWDSFSGAGNKIVQTPNIDRLAKLGSRYENAFVTTSVCPTSRASIMSGLRADKHQIWDFSTQLTDQQLASTYHEILHDAGYFTGFVGKWGIGAELPKAANFDYLDAFPQAGKYVTDSADTKHLTEYNGDAAVSFLKDTPKDKPFCLTVSFWAPHAQANEKEENPVSVEFSSLYADDHVPFPPSYSPTFADGLPKFMHADWTRMLFDRRHSTEELHQHFVKGYYRLVTVMDRQIGRIMDTLQENDTMDETLILFVSDNGILFGEHGLSAKWLMFEESIRVPLIISYPKWVLSSPSVRQETALNIDVAPTILYACGIEQIVKMDGVPLQLFEAHDGLKPREMFTYEYKLDPFFCLGVRSDQWKLSWYAKAQESFLFNLIRDPHEQTNLFGNPSVENVQEMLWNVLKDTYENTSLWPS